ncbi:1-aminocyclopropane-1-carboxylate deaminase/D-cysteine desulfhydrase [Taklimakanibacter deserti]|uniref:1-aminocyclopropane-1-carboxylate deaminase/D-cysteine desulfhydrase n=1 Tax=Taklimakanibacter deserti TaxID=2267839 RepID=UPI000E64E38D
MTSPIRDILARMPRARLLSTVPPLERWDRLSDELGISLFVKREDLGGIGAGGNKLRKLELVLGKAKSEGASWLLTTGGPQSNHARLTAAVAAKLGMGCTLMLRGPWSGALTGNLFLDQIFGAEIRLLGEVDYAAADLAMAKEADLLRQRGEAPAIIPLGGATAEGTAAYVEAFAELTEQMDEPIDHVVVAAGTVSTYTGLALGARLFSPATRVLGISVSWTQEKLRSEAARLFALTAERLGLGSLAGEDLWFDVGFIGPGYARISQEGRSAVLLAARREGTLLDMTYTGKAFAGLIGNVARGSIPKGSRVIFIHTGGTPELYTRNSDDLMA